MATTREKSVFESLGLGKSPVMLAPLAGVSDHPFRRICSREGADLTYVEMLSATAILCGSKKTYDMMERHPAEGILGVQVTGKTPEEVGRAIEAIEDQPFDTVDLNMGCPVQKVVKVGCGSAILKDPERVYETVRAARQATAKPLSAKIRLGWDRSTVTASEVGQAVEEAGGQWLTVHGRLRCDDYSVPVDLEALTGLKRRLNIPVVGNGNLFTGGDGSLMQDETGVDGLMVSRGALGNPWVFRDLKGDPRPVTLDTWRGAVVDHLRWQAEAYGAQGRGAVCMRKHLLWYVRGWPGAKRMRESLVAAEDLDAARAAIEEFADRLAADGVTTRSPLHDGSQGRFQWDPKYEMDRRLDRGVGDDRLAATPVADLRKPRFDQDSHRIHRKSRLFGVF